MKNWPVTSLDVSSVSVFRVPLEIKVWPSKRDIGVKAEIFIWQQSGIGTICT